MRYALLSDVHANRPALEAVLADIDAQSEVDAIYHGGDLVGYASWPNEVVAMIRGAGIAGVAGNYDSTVATGYKHCGCRYEDARQEELAHESYQWTLANSSADTKRFLGSLPFRLDVRPFGGHRAGPTIRLVHGNQTLNTVYVTADRSDEFLARMGESLGAQRGDVVCFGHTHKPWHRVVNAVHYVNTGSVGRPKDGDPRAGYVLLVVNESGIAVEFRRVTYDVEAAARAIMASTLPDDLADYLRHGGIPA
ncbi:MAG TPA: metallophosphoesterase family protein [Gemmatimonadaceae bacterium]|nr:metallophosphoesterase family protein [Gemmatimonadaceae bacterium]